MEYQLISSWARSINYFNDDCTITSVQANYYTTSRLAKLFVNYADKL